MPTSTDTFQRVDPVTFKVTNEVEGRFKAQGIDFTTDVNPTYSQIRWKRQDGAWIAYVDASRPANPGGSEQSHLAIGAKSTESQGEETRLDFYRTRWPDSTATASIQAFAGGSPNLAVRTILDHLGNSDFSVETATSAAVATVFGQIPGPWPVSITIPLNGSKNYLVGVFGSAMKQGAAGMIYLDVTWNGVNKGSLQQWNNSINVHTPLNPLFFAVNAGSGTHTLAVSHGGGAGVTWSNADSRLTYFILGNM